MNNILEVKDLTMHYETIDGDVEAVKNANEKGDQRIKYVGDLSWVQLISLSLIHI